MLCVVHLKHLSCQGLNDVKPLYKDLVPALYVYTTISMWIRDLAEQFIQLSLDLTKTLPHVKICEIWMKIKSLNLWNWLHLFCFGYLEIKAFEWTLFQLILLA